MSSTVNNTNYNCIQSGRMSVLLETSLGDIVIDLYTKDRPRSALNFLKLCKLKMYNYCLIHSVQRNFVIQTGIVLIVLFKVVFIVTMVTGDIVTLPWLQVIL